VKHAEILALEQSGGHARGATLYLNLEPCCHTGRTGPCTDAILAAGIRRVVAAMPDPNPRVTGRGFEILRRAGVEVVSGILETDARRLNEAFARWIRTGLPLVTLKAALSLDGRVARPNQPPAFRVTRSRGGEKIYRPAYSPARRDAHRAERWISSEASRAEVQRMRHAADAVVTGIGTVLADDPLLTDRSGLPRRRPLVRVVLDSRLHVPLESKLVRSADGDVLVLTRASENSARAWLLEQEGVETLRIARTPDPRERRERGRKHVAANERGLPLREVIRALGELEMLNVVLEAGPRLMAGALAAETVDKVVLFYAPRFLGGDALEMLPRSANFEGRGSEAISRTPGLENVTLQRFGPDFAVEGYLRDVYGDC
jgi:diaminohydroxyphosphoribosylaminopyrimidine deaminase/5-amino-6-(5-phosphoribosylamino)uracil reductase